MSSRERKKRKYRELYAFTNVSGAPFTLDTYFCENTACFVVKKVTDKNVSTRMVCFLLLLVFYVVAVNLGLVNGWYTCPVFVIGVVGLWDTISTVKQGN